MGCCRRQDPDGRTGRPERASPRGLASTVRGVRPARTVIDWWRSGRPRWARPRRAGGRLLGRPPPFHAPRPAAGPAVSRPQGEAATGW